MDKSQLYNVMAERKSKPKDFQPYAGDNGRVNRCVELFKKRFLKQGGSLLDVGGGIGDLAFACKEMFDRVSVIDISQKNLEAAKAKGITDAILADIDRGGMLSIGQEEISVVTALDFIEHIIDPENFARECFRVLKPGGQVFVNTPNIQYWPHIQQLIAGRFPHTSGDHEVYHGGHLAFFTYLDLCEIFGTAGFTNFRQLKDEEGYNTFAVGAAFGTMLVKSATQKEYVDNCLKFGCPNLLFLAEKG